MTEDIQRRLEVFGSTATVDRIALTMDQIQQYNPPPNPAKLTDSRAADYVARYGDDSWELDALEPNVIVALVGDAITDARDDDAWSEANDEETKGRDLLSLIVERWDDVATLVQEVP